MSEDCPHCVFEKTEANCRGCFEGSHYKPKPITNADRIRAMTDEELAEWIETIADCRMCKIDEGHCSGSGLNSRASCMIKWLDWLRQEATNDP